MNAEKMIKELNLEIKPELDQGISLDKVVFFLSQEVNTNGTTDEFEQLEIRIESPLDNLEVTGGYMVIKSETGWSIDSPESFKNLLDKLANGVKIKID